MSNKIGVLIPTRGDRPEFIQFALKQLAGQTLQPDEILIKNEKPRNEKPDITYRYRTGVVELLKRGCDIIFFLEDDDYYKTTYLETMIKLWEENGRPEIFGLNHTIYYNIRTQKYVRLDHNNRASMMNTMVTSAVKDIIWCDDNYSYTDMHLWKTLKGKTASHDTICVGIKHGIGLCGGGGHVVDWKVYDKFDDNGEFIRSVVDQDAMKFYDAMALKSKLKFSKYQMKKKPFLTIITRVMEGKRNNLFLQHKESVKKLSDMDFEQLYIVDSVGVGMLNANKSFSLAVPYIEGEYVYLLDDDDFFTNPDFIEALKAFRGADVIFFKMKILTGDGDQMYPKRASWETTEPKRGQIGGSCFAVKKQVYEKYIHNFGHPSFGDWHFITEVLKDKSITTAWIDEKMAETGKVSRGAEE